MLVGLAIWSYLLAFDELKPIESRDNGSLWDEILNGVMVISLAYFIVYARVIYKETVDKAMESINNQARLGLVFKL